MGLVDLYRREYFYNSETRVGGSEITHNGLIASRQFLNCLTFSRANKPFICRICKKQKSKYTRYIGGHYEGKICINCFPEWVENSIKELEEIKNILEKNKKDLELNEKKWTKEMIIGGLN